MVVNVISTYATVGTCTRSDIITWIKRVLKVDIQKVEELCSGSEYCQMINIMFPNTIQMNKVRMNASLEREYAHNWKILQASFSKLKIEKVIPIGKLVLRKFHDNFDFAQWFKKFFEANYDGQAFDLGYLRKTANVPAKNPKSEKVVERQRASRKTSPVPKSQRSDQLYFRYRASSSDRSEASNSKSGHQPYKNLHQNYYSQYLTPPPMMVMTDCACQTSEMHILGKGEGQSNKYRQLIEDLEEKNKQIKYINCLLDMEKTFFVGKLRNIERICQKEDEEDPIIESINSILGATEDDFVPIQE